MTMPKILKISFDVYNFANGIPFMTIGNENVVQIFIIIK